MHFSPAITDKTLLAKCLQHQSPIPRAEKYTAYMRLLAIVILVGILLGKAASGLKKPDWETCELIICTFSRFFGFIAILLSLLTGMDKQVPLFVLWYEDPGLISQFIFHCVFLLTPHCIDWHLLQSKANYIYCPMNSKERKSY
jgi:hypothetical protein